MCILCVIQKWSRRVATMLPWLVIPLIGLWALSQLLPPAFRFEITSPRLACVFVLLVTLFWYEILMPQLSAWRVRRNNRLREKKRFEAIELQKLRKTATRRCRNCLTPYKDQNPSVGRFMCTYCGHVSKRPVLDLPVHPGLSNSGILKELVGKSGNILTGKVWSENGWSCGQDWLENGNWVNGSVAGKSSNWRENGGGFFSSNDHCMTEKSYSRAVIFFCKILRSFLLSVGWIWRKISRVTSSQNDSSSDIERSGGLGKRGENGVNFLESKGEKARRKAEEKKQARLERELLEEEEKKQREEVARLVEERRKLRDLKTDAEKDRSKGSTAVRGKDNKKEAERKRHERKNERDKGSSKSNSDAEELEKRVGRESDRKLDFDRKGDTDRRQHTRTGADSSKANSTETAHGSKVANNHSRGNAGTRYLDRVKGTFLSSSKGFNGGSFFGNGVNNATISKENKPSGSVDYIHTGSRKESPQSWKSNGIGDDKAVNRPVLIESQPIAAPKKSWQQLFTRSPAAPSPISSNVICRPNGKPQAETQNLPSSDQSFSGQSYSNPISFGLPSPFTLPSFSYVSSNSSRAPPLTSEPMFRHSGQSPSDFLPEELDIFEDPSYIPDPVSLLGPVSESLDNFQLDLGTRYSTDIGLGKPHTAKNLFAPFEISRPSPIASPISRTRVSDERLSNPFQHSSSPMSQDKYSSPMDSSSANEKGTWQMWGSSPLGEDNLGLVGGHPSWLLPPDLIESDKEEFVHSSSQKSMASLFTKDDQVLYGSQSPSKVFGGPHTAPARGPADDPWLPNTSIGLVPSSEGHFSFPGGTSQKESTYGNSGSPPTNHHLAFSPTNWTKNEWGGCQGSAAGEAVTRNSSSSSRTHHVGGLYPAPDVQSVWSYD